MGSLSGSVDAYGYNSRNEVISSLRTLDGSEVRGFTESFTYDPIGNRVTATEHDETGAAHVSRYTANGLNQYASRTVPGLASARGFAHSDAFVTVNGNEAFRMGEYYFGSDQFDNSVQSGYAEVETYAALNCETNDLVSSVTNVAFLASATESFIYDDDGNLLEDARFRYFWNGENRMVRAEEKIAPPGREPYVVIYTYDHMGRNVMKDGARFLWDDYNIIVENVGASNETHNVWGLDLDGTIQGAGGVGGLLAVARHGTVAFPAYDANGNITEYVSAGGEILSHSEYSSFGRELVHSGSDDFTHRFSTKPLCRKTGLLEYQLRKYKPWCGRWMNRDAIEEDGGLNLYGFVGNRVLMSVDLFGNGCGCGEEITAVFAVGPIDALIANNLAQKALIKTQELSDELGGGIHNGPADAFRHCYWSCLMSKEIGEEQSKKIGDIHEECASNQDPAEASMDLHNNAKGREIAKNGDCEKGCKESLKKGELQSKKKGCKSSNENILNTEIELWEKEK